MKVFKLLIIMMLFTAASMAQTTPWASTPTVIPQTRSFNGAKEIRFLYSTNIIAIIDSLNARAKFSNFGNGIRYNGGQVKLGGTTDETIDINVGVNSLFNINSNKFITPALSISNSNGPSINTYLSSTYANSDNSIIKTSQLLLLPNGSSYFFNIDENSGQQRGLNLSSNGHNYFYDQFNSVGLEYLSDYSSQGKLSNRWLPDWGAVKSRIDSAVTGGAVDTTLFARKIGSADLVQNSYRGNYLRLNNQITTPATPSSGVDIFVNANNNFSYINSNGRVTSFISPYPNALRMYRLPYKNTSVTPSTLADSTDVSNVYLKKADSTAATGYQTVGNFFPKADPRYVNVTGDNMSGALNIVSVNPQLALNYDGTNTTSLGTNNLGYFGIVASNGTYIGGTGPTSSPFNISSSLQSSAANQFQFGGSSMVNYVAAFRKPTAFTLPDNTNFAANVFGAVNFTRPAGAAYNIANVVVKPLAAGGGTTPATISASLWVDGPSTGSTGAARNRSIYVLSGTSEFGGDIQLTTLATAGAMLKNDANKNIVVAIAGTDYLSPTGTENVSNKTFRTANTFQSATGGTSDSLAFVNTQRHVSKALVAGAGVSINQTASTVTISTAPNVVEISGTSQAATGNTIYIPHNVALTTITIPTTTTIGTLYQVVGEGSGGWRFVLPPGAVAVGVGGFTTTSGGSISSTDRYCTLTIRYAATNKFVVTTSQGTLTPL